MGEVGVGLVVIGAVILGLTVGWLFGLDDARRNHCRAGQFQDYAVNDKGRIICVKITREEEQTP